MKVKIIYNQTKIDQFHNYVCSFVSRPEYTERFTLCSIESEFTCPKITSASPIFDTMLLRVLMICNLDCV